MGNIVKLGIDATDRLAPLIAGFRAELKSFKGISAEADLAAAITEAMEFFAAGFPIYAYEEAGRYLGYLICRVDGAVWVEHFYVVPEHRGRGIADALYDVAEGLAAPDTPYNWIHPNNDAMIRFLAKRGYDVLNLIEVRKRRVGEVLRGKVEIMGGVYEY